MHELGHCSPPLCSVVCFLSFSGRPWQVNTDSIIKHYLLRCSAFATGPSNSFDQFKKQNQFHFIFKAVISRCTRLLSFSQKKKQHHKTGATENLLCLVRDTATLRPALRTSTPIPFRCSGGLANECLYTFRYPIFTDGRTVGSV